MRDILVLAALVCDDNPLSTWLSDWTLESDAVTWKFWQYRGIYWRNGENYAIKWASSFFAEVIDIKYFLGSTP